MKSKRAWKKTIPENMNTNLYEKQTSDVKRKKLISNYERVKEQSKFSFCGMK